MVCTEGDLAEKRLPGRDTPHSAKSRTAVIAADGEMCRGPNGSGRARCVATDAECDKACIHGVQCSATSDGRVPTIAGGSTLVAKGLQLGLPILMEERSVPLLSTR